MSLLKTFMTYVACRNSMEEYPHNSAIYERKEKVARILEKYLIRKLEKKQTS